MNAIDKKRIECWIVLVMAEVNTIDEVPEKYRNEVKIQIAQITLAELGSGD